MKKHIKKLLFISAVVVCFSITATAQKTNDKKGERNLPTINVPGKDRKPTEDKPKDKKDKKKEQFVAEFVREKVGVDI